MTSTPTREELARQLREHPGDWLDLADLVLEREREAELRGFEAAIDDFGIPIEDIGYHEWSVSASAIDQVRLELARRRGEGPK